MGLDGRRRYRARLHEQPERACGVPVHAVRNVRKSGAVEHVWYRAPRARLSCHSRRRELQVLYAIRSGVGHPTPLQKACADMVFASGSSRRVWLASMISSEGNKMVGRTSCWFRGTGALMAFVLACVVAALTG